MRSKSVAPFSLSLAIDAAQERLTESDRQLAALLLADTTQSSYLSANEVARQAGVHPTTAVRFARKLGFENYSEMRSQLRSSVLRQGDSSDLRMKTRLQRVSQGSVLQALVDSEVRAMLALPAQIDDAQLKRAAQMLLNADRILVCGTGHAAALASLLALRLARSGYRAQSLDRWDWRTMEALANMRKNDVLIAVTLRRMSKPAVKLMDQASSLGIRSLVVSDVAGFKPQPDLVLCAHRGHEGESQSLTVPMAICNALVLEVARLDQGKSMKALEVLSQLRRSLPDWS